MRRLQAAAKINLALVVGPLRADGKHEVATVLQRVDLHDRIAVSAGERLRISGFADDTIVAAALQALAAAAGVEPAWTVEITKSIPVAAGLGGGSSDAASALLLANELLPEPLERDRLHELAATIGSDVPFFLARGPQLGTGDGTVLDAARPAAGLLRRARSARRDREEIDARRLRGLRRQGRAGRIRRASGAARRGARRDPQSPRPGTVAAERPVGVTDRGATPRSGSVPGRRQRSRALRLRPLRTSWAGRRQRRARCGPSGAPGSPRLSSSRRCGVRQLASTVR